MSDDPEIVTPDLGGLTPPARPDPLAAALTELQPAPAALNRDRLMFAAGAESRRPVVRLWQATAGFLAAVGFAAGLYFRPSPPAAAEPQVIEKVVEVRVPVPAAEPAPEPPPTTTAPEPDEPVTTAGPGYLTPFYHRPEPGTPAHWFQLRNDILTAGLGLLPDPGPRFDPPRRGGP